MPRLPYRARRTVPLARPLSLLALLSPLALLPPLAAGGCSGGGRPAISGGVLQHHNDAARDGVYVDPALTHAAAAAMHLDPTFAPVITGLVFAQPLYLNGIGGKPDMLIVATQENHVSAFTAATGAQVWDRVLAPAVPLALFGCGDNDPLGIIGTPIIDGATRILYLDAMTTPDGGATKKHMVYALDADTGDTRPGWPVDVGATARVDTLTFDSAVQNQRGALALLGGTLFIPYGGLAGDCGAYHGWVVGVSITDPTKVSAWATRGGGGGIWGPSGIASDGTSLYFATGNTTRPDTWQDGEAVFKMAPSLVASGNTTDYFAPANWQYLDVQDADLGATAPVVLTVPGASPANLVIALGKDGRPYLLDRANLGGIGAPLTDGPMAGEGIMNAAVAYTTPMGTYVAFRGASVPSSCPIGAGEMTALKVSPSTPPTLSVAWCSTPSTVASPTVSMTDARGTDAMVWIVGTDDRLYALDGDGAGPVLPGSAATVPGIHKFHAPIIAKGRVFVAAGDKLYAFTPR